MEKLFEQRMQENTVDREAMIKEAKEKERSNKIALKDKEETMQKLIDAETARTEAVANELKEVRESRDQLFEEKFKVEEVVDKKDKEI